MKLTKALFSNILLFSSFLVFNLSCARTPEKSEVESQEKTVSPQVLISELNTTFSGPTLTDSRDGETYPIVTIGNQNWMAENLRYNAPGSQVNPQFPSTQYGRLYDGITAQTACPEDWHLPSDAEWNEMEILLGMPPAEADKTGWRGEHGAKMKSTTDWADEGNGTNSSGFNGLPSGFYGEDISVGGIAFDGYTGSAGYWSAMEGSKAWVRFLGGPLLGVNRFEDDT